MLRCILANSNWFRFTFHNEDKIMILYSHSCLNDDVLNGTQIKHTGLSSKGEKNKRPRKIKSALS